MANFHIPRVFDVDFMAMINLIIYRGWGGGCTFTENAKTLNYTKIWLLNVNQGSEISHDAR